MDDLTDALHDLALVESEEDAPLINRLARLLYARRGYVVPAGFDFAASSHPQEREAFEMATIALNFVREEGP